MIEIKNLCKTYVPKNGVPVKALDNVSIKIAEKGMVFVLGKSGSGKSTFLNVVGGLDKYDSGELIVYGKSSKDFSQSEFDSYRNTYIGFIFQEYNIMDEFSVGQNIALALQLQGKKASKEAVANIMEQVDLKGFENRKTNELSGGQKQRVAIARALIKDPKIIMADEPTGALDSKTGEQVFDTLKKLSKDKLVLIVSHDRDFAERYADRIIEFSDGKVVSDTVKTEIAATSESDAVTVIDGKILQIKCGAELTKKDLDVINSYIKNNEGDTFISTDGELNKTLRKTSKITDGGAKETFKTTEQEDVELKQYGKGDFNTVKSKLPFGNSLKIALSSLKTKPVRLFFTVLLSAVAFTLFGLMSVFSTYDTVRTRTETISNAQLETVAVYRTEGHTFEFDGEVYYSQCNFTADEYAEIVTDFSDKGIGFLKVSGAYFSYRDLLGNELHKFGNYYSDSFSGLSAIDESLMNKFGFSKIGELPVSENQIAVTKYFYDCYKNSYETSKTEGWTTESLLGKTLEFNNKTYTITAVIDTKFDTAGKFDALKTSDTSSIQLTQEELNYLKSEFEDQISNGAHNLCYFSSAFWSEYEIDKASVQTNNGNLSYRSGTAADSKDFYGIYPLSTLEICESRRGLLVYYPSGKNLSGKTVIVDSGVFQNYNAETPPREISDYYGDIISALTIPSAFDSTVIENYKQQYGMYEDAADIDVYLEYLGKDGWNSSEYGKSGKETAAETALKAAEQWWNALPSEEKFFRLEYTEWTFDGMNTKIIETDPVAVSIGQLPVDEIPDESIGNFYNVFSSNDLTFNAYVGNDVISDINGKINSAYTNIVAQVPEDKTDLQSFVEYFDKKENMKGWELNAAVLSELSIWDVMIEVFKEAFLYAGIGLAVFAAFLMMNFISTSIVYKKREIGILRAIGARGSDVFGIFFKEAAVIALINFALSLGFLFAALFGLNNAIASSITAPIKLFNMTILTPLLMIGLSLLTAAIASFIPCYRISVKRPIDAIRNK